MTTDHDFDDMATRQKKVGQYLDDIRTGARILPNPIVEYTPETVNVRAIYGEAMEETFGFGLDVHLAEFDRWLEGHDNIVRAIAGAGR